MRSPEQLMIRDVPAEDRPRERLSREGPASLSNAELVAILLRTGTASESVLQLANRVLSRTEGLKGLAGSTLNELVQIKGIGPAKGIQLLAGIELGRRVFRALPAERTQIRSPGDAADYVMDEMRHLSQEHFLCLFLNTKNRVIDKKCIFVGSLNSSVVHPREVFREAIRRSSAGVICVHNHPSGDPTPSREDIHVTERLVEAGQIVGIELLDHIIIGDHRYYSMKEKGIIPV
ncbi:DNA repair protein RadC [Desmospora sp. 8437]|uniref:DNA replication and repair protein RadC n=2 Tax=Kroppenstedtia eburnea TaxID=714067 RepID=A0A1N7M370_9BACL|nr:DNA repair protein RadC [Desmospora sp. 8437]SIS80565.1 DNA replication and repair protein RadC [Kroppenstedtia eburnea]